MCAVNNIVYRVSRMLTVEQQCELVSDQVGEVGYSGQRLTDDELEGDRSEQKNERQLESTLRNRQLDGERRERQTADEQLPTQHNQTIV